MLAQYIGRIRKAASTVPRIHHTEFKPTNFSYNINDLGRLYALREWQAQNTPSYAVRREAMREMEEIHNELTYVNTYKQVIRMAILFAVTTFWFFLMEEEVETRKDFRHNFDQKYSNKLYMDLDEGGFEGQ